MGVTGPPRYEIFHDVMGAAVLDWRRRYVAQRQQAESSRELIEEREEARAEAQMARRQLRKTLLAAALAVILLGVISVFAYQSYRNTEQQTYLTRAAAGLGYNPVQSLKFAVNAYQVKGDKQARSAVLTAASSPRSQVVAGSNSMMIGMARTPDLQHVVAYDAHGDLRVIGEKGAVEHATKVSGLHGPVTFAPDVAAVSPDASRIALGTDQGTVAVIDTATGRHVDIDSEGRSSGVINNAGFPTVVRWIGSTVNGRILVVSRSGFAATYSSVTGKQVAHFPGGLFRR